ncbi:histidine kinase [Orenia metallireducens]|uniref:Stage 0 sporulation protein A homolog n=1 Tax=Orenia metallireducens TaxID=1413210 RepID=A0A1C0AAX5_9FIRM|nr:response regulator [Orenia metallireducens]OCL27532.1 histidine kinase [Orenia metallireducens]
MDKKKILIIDDEKNIRITLKQCLNQDYEVVTGVNGEDGLEKFKDDNFDLVLLDMKLPGIDGIEVLKKLKELDNNVNIVMITGFGTIETAVETMKMGAVDYLRKPFAPNEIREIVKEVLDRQSLAVSDEELNSYEDYLSYAKSAISKRDFTKGYNYLQNAVGLDATKPEAFNLMGVIMELQDNLSEAQKNYRAALSLDPAYRPAQENLERSTQFDYQKEGINLGEEIDKEGE